jgi:hypothetical protein
MSQSTPINKLPRENMNNQQTNNMVDDILNEMDDTKTDFINTDINNYAMDPSQIPPEKMNENFLNEMGGNNQQQEHTTNKEYKDSKESEESSNKESNTNSFLSKLNLNTENLSMEDLISKCLKQVKYAIVVFILVIIVSLPEFNRVVFTKIKGMLLESGEINMKGVLLKAVLATVLFLISTFVL